MVLNVKLFNDEVKTHFNKFNPINSIIYTELQHVCDEWTKHRVRERERTKMENDDQCWTSNSCNCLTKCWWRCLIQRNRIEFQIIFITIHGNICVHPFGVRRIFLLIFHEISWLCSSEEKEHKTSTVFTYVFSSMHKLLNYVRCIIKLKVAFNEKLVCS